MNRLGDRHAKRALQSLAIGSNLVTELHREDHPGATDAESRAAASGAITGALLAIHYELKRMNENTEGLMT